MSAGRLSLILQVRLLRYRNTPAPLTVVLTGLADRLRMRPVCALPVFARSDGIQPGLQCLILPVAPALFWKQKMVDLPGHSSQPLPLHCFRKFPQHGVFLGCSYRCLYGRSYQRIFWNLRYWRRRKQLDTCSFRKHPPIQSGEFGITDVFTVRGEIHLWFRNQSWKNLQITDYGQSWTVATTIRRRLHQFYCFPRWKQWYRCKRKRWRPNRFCTHHRRRSYMVFRRK